MERCIERTVVPGGQRHAPVCASHVTLTSSLWWHLQWFVHCHVLVMYRTTTHLIAVLAGRTASEAEFARVPLGARARAVHRVAGAAVLAETLLGARGTVARRRARRRAQLSRPACHRVIGQRALTGVALARAVHGVALVGVVARARPRAVGAPHQRRTLQLAGGAAEAVLA